MIDFVHSLTDSIAAFFSANKAVILVFATSAAGAALGALGAGYAILRRARESDDDSVLQLTNISIAVLISLLGKLINFKKDYAFPAAAEAEAMEQTLAALAQGETAAPETLSIALEQWVEIEHRLDLPQERIFSFAGTQLDTIQIVKMLECNLAELAHLVRQRNGLIAQMNRHQESHGTLPLEGIRLYLKYAGMIARNTDENLFFVDKAIDRLRKCAQGRLPRAMHRLIADIGMRPETAPLMPAPDMIKSFK